MKLTLALAMVLLPQFAIAADEARFVDACEIAIKSRLSVPQTYRRLSDTVDVHVLTAADVTALFKKAGARQLALNEKLADLASGKWQPVDVRILVDYEGTDETATVLHKRSYCYMRIQGTDGAVFQPMVEVDGMLGATGQWTKLDHPQ
jgi:hypothetical protein